MKNAPIGLTNPAAGVIATRPATAPEHNPRRLGFFSPENHSANIQAIPALAAAIWVTSIAIPALPFAATAEPALKPNQPTQSIEAPIIVSATLCGRAFDFRFPITSAATKPAIPELMWTTVPPAKSKTPILER